VIQVLHAAAVAKTSAQLLFFFLSLFLFLLFLFVLGFLFCLGISWCSTRERTRESCATADLRGCAAPSANAAGAGKGGRGGSAGCGCEEAECPDAGGPTAASAGPVPTRQLCA